MEMKDNPTMITIRLKYEYARVVALTFAQNEKTVETVNDTNVLLALRDIAHSISFGNAILFLLCITLNSMVTKV